MKNIIIIIAIIFMTSCAGKTGQVINHSIGEGIIKKNYGIHKHETITFTTIGEKVYTGRPSTLVFYAYSVSVNLNAIQKVVAKNILESIYDNVEDSGNSSQIISEISDFEYKWPAFSFSSNAIVSFKIHFLIRNKKGDLTSKEYIIKEFEGSDKKTFMAGALFGVAGASLSGNVDERSQMVTNTTLEAVNQVYEKHIAEIIGNNN